MIKARHALLLLFAICICGMASAREESKYLYRLYAGPIIAFYKNNPDYTINTRARASLTVGARMEYMINGYSSMTFAAEYVTHSLAFDSYHFEPGTQQLVYDKTFPFHHDVRLHEVHVPFIAKFNATKENDKPFNSYLLTGWAYRYIFASTATITSNVNGSFAWIGNINADEEYSLFTKKGGSILLAGFGTERNFQPKRTSAYIEFTYKFGLSRFRYQGSGVAREFFIKDSFLSVNIGYKL